MTPTPPSISSFAPHSGDLAQNQLAALVEGEKKLLASLVGDTADGIGLLAFALHRRAVLAWLDAFYEAEARLPDPREIGHFMLGEAAALRQQDYRREAARLMSEAAHSNPPAPNSTRQGPLSSILPVQNPVEPKKSRPAVAIWPFGPSAGLTIAAPTGPLPWRGLFLRLLLLLAAVIVTAVMLRIFAVPHY